MRLSSFRLSLLDFVARVLSRWLNAVNTRIETTAPTHTADQPFDARSRTGDNPPPPPDHWVEMVRQRAPQLLDPNADASSGVIDFRADDALVEPPRQQPRQPGSAPVKARPVTVITPHHRVVAPISTVKTSSNRPLRLGNVRVQPLDAASVSVHSAQTDAAALEVPTTPASQHDPAELLIRRPAEPEADSLPVRAYPDLPVEQHIREINPSFADVPNVPSIRTSAGSAQYVNQRQTSVPNPPEQTVLRPLTTYTTQTVHEELPNLWASLPESAAEDVYNPHAEQNHRARLRREQEGRAWSE